MNIRGMLCGLGAVAAVAACGGGGGPRDGGPGGEGTGTGGAGGASGGRGGSNAPGGSGSGGSAGAAGRTGGGGNGGGPGPGGTTFVYVSGTASSLIRVYRLDAADGTLRPSSMTIDGGANPTYLAFHPNKKFLYAVNEAGTNSKLLAFAIDAAGALTKLATGGEATTTPGQGPPHLSVHASGKWIYAAHYGSGHTTVHPILAGGGVGAPTSNDKTAVSEAHQAKQDPTGKFLFVPCRTPNFVAQYRIDDATGALIANNPARVTPPVAGTGPRHMDFHPNGRWAYVLGELNGHVVTYDYDGTTGLLSNPADLVIRAGESAAAHIQVHPSGRFVFASLRTGNEIATLAVDAATGRLAVTAHQTSLISGPRNFTIDPSGRFLLVANSARGTVEVFEINDVSGALTSRSTLTDTVPQPQFVGSLVLP